MDFACPCGKLLKVQEDQVGKEIRCPSCGGKVQVPQLTAAKGGPHSSPFVREPSPSNVGANSSFSISSQETLMPPQPRIPVSEMTSFLAPPQMQDELGRLGNYRILQVLGQGGM